MLPLWRTHAAEQLDVVVPHSEDAAARLAADGEGVDQDVVEGLPGGQTRAKPVRLLGQFGIRERLILRLQRIDRVDLRLHPLQKPRVGRSEDARHPALEPLRDAATSIGEGFPNPFQRVVSHNISINHYFRDFFSGRASLALPPSDGSPQFGIILSCHKSGKLVMYSGVRRFQRNRVAPLAAVLHIVYNMTF